MQYNEEQKYYEKDPMEMTDEPEEQQIEQIEQIEQLDAKAPYSIDDVNGWISIGYTKINEIIRTINK